MAIKYKSRWVNVDEVECSLELDVPGYVGDIINLNNDPVYESPFNISLANSGLPFPEIGICCSTATFNAVGDNTLNLFELAEKQDREVKAYYKQNGELFWAGYCIPDSINWDYDSSPYRYTINFTDGLNLLDKLPYTVVNLNPPAGANIRCPLNWFRGALNYSENLGISLPIEWCMTSLKNQKWLSEDVFAGSVMWGEDERSFIYYNENPNIKRKRSCKYVLENMLIAFGARLFQNKGVWHIERIKDILTGNYTKFKIPASFVGIPVVETIVVDTNKALGESGYPTQGVGTITVKKGLRSVVAKYEHNQSENVWPNGNMYMELFGNLIYWGIRPDAPGVYIERKDTITERGENSLQITYPPTGFPVAPPSGISLISDSKYTVPIDAHTLYKRFKWGFVFSPVSGFAVDDNGIIKWDDTPLKARVSFRIPKSGGGVKSYVLNEFGFWSPRLTGGKLTKYYEFISPDGAPTFTWQAKFYGTPISGDTIEWTFWNPVSSGPVNYLVTKSDEENLSQTLTNFMEAVKLIIPDFTYTVNIYIDPDYSPAYIVNASGNGYHRPSIILVKNTDATSLDGSISFKVDQMKMGDVAQVSFQNKSLNESWILFPDPGSLEGTLPSLTSELSIELWVSENQKIIYQDVKVELDDNYDVYESTINGSMNTASEEITTEISSQFTGVIPSNFQTTFTRSNEQWKYTDGISSGSLTKILAENMLRMNSRSAIMIQDQSFYCQNGAFDFGQIYTIPSFEGKKFLPLSTEYNTQSGVATITAREIYEDDASFLDTIHYGNNEYSTSN